MTFVDVRRAEVDALLSTESARAAIAIHGTPVLLLEPERVRAQYRALARALPTVRFHYAVKALSHDAVIDALAAEGCGFDVATGEEWRMLSRRGVGPDAVIHTHPVKKPVEIAEALAAGIRTFVVDSTSELAKFADAPSDVGLLVRLSYRSPHAKSDLSSKLGVGPSEARRLVAEARARGIRIRGFSFHVGSQLDDPARFARAVSDTLALMTRLEAELGIRFDTLDIGGGFPVAYDRPVAQIQELGAVLRPLLEGLRVDVIAEPGRFLVADAMTLVTSVVGVAERADGRWYHLDDGVYGSYSNVVAEDVHPLVFPVGHPEETAARRWATLAGPTCDSADVIAREVLLPDLSEGDMLVSPAMGAYTAVTASRFNGREPAPIVVLTAAPTTAEVPAIGRMPGVAPARTPEVRQTVP